MPHGTAIKPNHKAIQAYYAALQTYKEYEVRNEGALETAFQRLLADLLTDFYSYTEPHFEGFEQAVDEMLVQHLLTERLIREIFANADFTRRNVIAAERDLAG